MRNLRLKYFDKYVMRTPLFPVESLNSDSYSTCKEFLESLYIASPDLYTNMEADANSEDKVRLSAKKYFSRACTRPTPFGLFAGCSVGTIEGQTEIELTDIEDYRRCTRLDMQYLCALIQRIENDPNISPRLMFYPNDSIYKIGDKIRYVEYHYIGTRRIHRISSVEITDYLEFCLDNSHQGITIHDLAEKLKTYCDVSREEAETYILELISSQLLKSELEPAVVGDDILTSLIDKLSRFGQSVILEDLKLISMLLGQIDLSPIGDSLYLYDKIIDIISRLGISYEKKYLFQTDMFKPVKHASISSSVMDEIIDAVSFLSEINNVHQNPNIASFKEAFNRRFENQEVSLALVLDNELGLGYPVTGAANDVNALVDDLVLPRNSGAMQGGSMYSHIDTILLQKYIEAIKRGDDSIVIKNQDFSNRTIKNIPDTIGLMFSLVKDDEAGRLIYLKPIGGSSGANLLGRFSHIDPSIFQFVKEIADKEKESNNDKIVAEISHLPESRIGNIASRPKFRDYIIHYLSNVNECEEDAISIDDLMISLKNDRIYLRSKRLDKEIVPRLSCAHNYSMTPIPIYRFLCDIQNQYLQSGFHLGWGNLFSTFEYLPRIKYNNVILQRAKWLITKTEIEECLKMKDEELQVFFCEFARKRNMPRHVMIPEGDNEMLIDFENLDSVKIMLDLVKKKPSFKVEEFLFSTESVVKNGNTFFANEIISVLHK